jgi:hypothetical protein
MSVKKSNDTIGNGTDDLPACSAVPQPTAPPRASTLKVKQQITCRVVTPIIGKNRKEQQ